MLQAFIKIILYFLLGYLVFFLYRFFKAISGARKTQGAPKKLTGTMVKDEFCNTYLPKEEAVREVIDGKEYFFCSMECRQKFLETKKS